MGCFVLRKSLSWVITDGIIELEGNYKVGQSFSDCLDDESVEIEIAITPNRGDCASVYGIARDLNAAGFGTIKEKKLLKLIPISNQI